MKWKLLLLWVHVYSFISDRTMFGSLLLLGCLFLHLVVSIPQPACRRCCDHLPPLDDAATLRESMPVMPEVRTYINMTILKGTRKSASAYMTKTSCVAHKAIPILLGETLTLVIAKSAIFGLTKNEKLMKTYWNTGHPRSRWDLYF